MRRWLERWFCATSPLRGVIDLLWIGGFVAVAVVMLLQARAFRPFQSQVQLSLVEGTQQRGLYRDGRKLGQIEHEVRRTADGWHVVQRFASGAVELGQAEMELRRDLSLRKVRVDVDLGALAGVHSSVTALMQLLGGGGVLQLKGSCSLRTGECSFDGTLGKRRITHAVTAGRGPALPSAVYPLLARGVLGKQVELNLLDPMSLQRRVVTFTLQGRRELRLRQEVHDALLVEQRFAGIESKLWLDRRGRVLKETLPLGLSVEHESWKDPDDGPKE